MKNLKVIKGVGKRLVRYMAFAIVVSLSLTGCKEDLYTQLTERQANEMLSVLIQSGITSKKVSSGKGMFKLVVEETDLAASVSILDSSGLPGDSFSTMADLYKKEGLISSPMEERIRYMFALSQSIAETLTNIDGVLVARVHVALPESDKYSSNVRPTSASVFIKHRDDFMHDRAIPEIKRIVESSIEGLQYDRIAIFMSVAANNSPSNESTETLVEFGPLNISKDSIGAAKTLFVILIAALFLGFSTIGLIVYKTGFHRSLNKRFNMNENTASIGSWLTSFFYKSFGRSKA